MLDTLEQDEDIISSYAEALMNLGANDWPNVWKLK